MTAFLPFVRYLPQPGSAGFARLGQGRLLASPPQGVVPPLDHPLRTCPAFSAAPRLEGQAHVAFPTVARQVRRGAAAAVLVSCGLHAGLVLAVVSLVNPVQPLAPPDLEIAEVALLTESQFRALTAPQPTVAAAPEALEQPPPDNAPPDNAPSDNAQSDLAALPVPQIDSPAPSHIAPPAPPFDAAAEALPDVLPPSPPLNKTGQFAQQAPQKPQKAKPQKPKAQDSQKAPVKSASPKAAVSAPQKNQTATSGQSKALKADWGAKVRARINRHVKRPGGAGTVKVQLKIAPNGSLLAAGVVTSSGQAALDRAALTAVKAAAPFARAPKGLNDASYSFTLPIRFDG